MRFEGRSELRFMERGARLRLEGIGTTARFIGWNSDWREDSLELDVGGHDIAVLFQLGHRKTTYKSELTAVNSLSATRYEDSVRKTTKRRTILRTLVRCIQLQQTLIARITLNFAPKHIKRSTFKQEIPKNHLSNLNPFLLSLFA